jgi:ribonuclease HI
MANHQTPASRTSYPTMIFADGASSGNPGPGGWGAIIARPDLESQGQVTELGGRDDSTTNNKMELTAVIRALDAIREETGPVAVYTDSVYVIRGITQWVWGWTRRNWKTAEGGEVANQELWRKLMALVIRRKEKGHPVDWHFVRGHSGIPGNERVDEIAVAFSKGSRPRLYSGPLLSYDVAIHDIPENTELPAPSPRKEPKAPAYSYLSLLGNTPMRHSTWAECERRVKGQSGAKFKKTMSAQEEEEILANWGFSINDLKI